MQTNEKIRKVKEITKNKGKKANNSNTPTKLQKPPTPSRQKVEDQGMDSGHTEQINKHKHIATHELPLINNKTNTGVST